MVSMGLSDSSSDYSGDGLVNYDLYYQEIDALIQDPDLDGEACGGCNPRNDADLHFHR